MTTLSREASLALPYLHAVLTDAIGRGQDCITWDDLCVFCRGALCHAGGPLAGKDANQVPVLVAVLIYCYVRQRRPWTLDHTRRERLYLITDMAQVVRTLQET